jgi:hypothetical protein
MNEEITIYAESNSGDFDRRRLRNSGRRGMSQTGHQFPDVLVAKDQIRRKVASGAQTG